MKLLSSAIAAYRNFSTKNTKFCQPIYRKKYQSKYHGNDLAKPRKTKIKWTDQQKKIVDAVTGGQSVFISGSAGTGKTVLVEHIIKQLKKIHGRSKVVVTGSTGAAACAIRGQTLHSFAGIGLGEGDRMALLSMVLSNKKAYRGWNKVKALVIDEISMVDATFFESVEYIAREIREKDKTWGGIQLVVSGDFFQLPPISKKSSSIKEFAFEADCWDSSFDMQFELTTIFRQSDAQLVKLLQGIRRGKTDPEDLQLLEKCCSETEPDSSVARFYPRNDDVCQVNRKHLESLGEEIVVYSAVDEGVDSWKKQLKHVSAPDELKICIGARVMLIKNLNPWKKLVNGATGTVVNFKYNVTDVQGICECEILPIVNFDSGPKEVIIEPDEWVVMDGDKVGARRIQIPLMLAWALSIHKCQGMTLDSIHTDLSRAFGFGMVYVALSRVKSLSGLHLSGFDPSKIKAHPRVLQFYERFESAQDVHGGDDVDNKFRSNRSNGC